MCLGVKDEFFDHSSEMVADHIKEFLVWLLESNTVWYVLSNQHNLGCKTVYRFNGQETDDIDVVYEYWLDNVQFDNPFQNDIIDAYEDNR